jgi:hypothetical protein
MKLNPRLYYTIGILIALCASAFVKNKRPDIDSSKRIFQNRRVRAMDWDNKLQFELEPMINREMENMDN